LIFSSLKKSRKFLDTFTVLDKKRENDEWNNLRPLRNNEHSMRRRAFSRLFKRTVAPTLLEQHMLRTLVFE
jgi:hypothetical protein